MFLTDRVFSSDPGKRIKAHVSICGLGYMLLYTVEEKLSLFEAPLSCPASALKIVNYKWKALLILQASLAYSRSGHIEFCKGKFLG